MRPGDTIGLIRGQPDIHSLGISAAAHLLRECGMRVFVADASVVEGPALEAWVRQNKLSTVGFSYRLDPDDAVVQLGRFRSFLGRHHLNASQGGPVGELYFAGLPEACRKARHHFPDLAGVFPGGETPRETLAILGLSADLLPSTLREGTSYDDDRWKFAQVLVESGVHREFRPEDRSGYPEFGTTADRLDLRLDFVAAQGQLPLMRAHVGPWGQPREAAVDRFLDWCHTLGASSLLDVLSIGSSQLTQDAFFDDWGARPNGGGVPVRGEDELAAVWRASRPLLVRTYAGTKDMERLVGVYERSIRAAWHTFSFWWFNQLDGRGPSPVKASLEEHFRTLALVAAAGKPFEPNVPHHFSFRGGDDASYVLSGYLAARAARDAGVPLLVLQVMLNTPRATWGIQDLAKARALLTLVRELEGPGFRVVLQPRAGLDYFSSDLEKAKVQLVASTALMDDIEPLDTASPGIVHVVSYSEASALADPAIIHESVQLTQTAFREYRRLRNMGLVTDMGGHLETRRRTEHLVAEVRAILATLEAEVPRLYSAEGFYRVLRAGVFPLPDLWEGREELKAAVGWRTAMHEGGVVAVDAEGGPLAWEQRRPAVVEALRGSRA